MASKRPKKAIIDETLLIGLAIFQPRLVVSDRAQERYEVAHPPDICSLARKVLNRSKRA